MLGLCRKSGKLTAGHDTAVESIVKGGSRLVILASDASDRLKAEIAVTVQRSRNGPPVIVCDMTMDEIGIGIGKRAAVVSVTDENLAAKIRELFGEE